MTSQECISDSEDENEMLLEPSMLSATRMRQVLGRLEPLQREAAENSLARTGMSIPDIEAAHEIHHNDYELPEIPTGSERLQPSSPQPQRQSHEEDEIRRQEDENNTNLRIYLDSRNYESVASRRGLRKRNFSSTHPYLADQAHYLGLSSVNYLNELYSDKQDFEHIVKYLNFTYRKMKESNPRDEKYRAKNFYAILGKQSALAREKEEEEINKEKDGDSENAAFNQLTQQSQQNQDFSDYESEDSQGYPAPVSPRYSVENQYPSNESDFEDSDSEVVSKKTLLGNLPGLYKASMSRKQARNKHMELEYRKGLAIKKKSHAPKSFKKPDMFDFVDDNIDQDVDNQFYRRFDTSHEAMSDFDMPLRSFETFGILSETSGSEEEMGGYDSDMFKRPSESPASSPKPILVEDISIQELSDGSVEEMDTINPMFANRTIHKRKRNLLGEKRPKVAKSRQSGIDQFSSHSDKENRVPRTYKKKANRHPTASPKIQRTHNTHNETASVPSRFKTYTETKREKNPVPRGTLRKKALNKSSGSKKSKSTVKPPYTLNQLSATDTRSSINSKPDDPTTTKNKPNSAVANPKDLLRKDYYFRRAPVQYTTAFEAESERSFVQDRAKLSSTFRSLQPGASTFPFDFITSSINVSKVQNINEGKTYILPMDTVHCEFHGESFTFTLVDTIQSTRNCERLLFLIARDVKDLQNIPEESVEKGLYFSFKTLMQWYLIIQEPPNEKVWKLMNHCKTILLHDNRSGKKGLLVYPWLVLLYSIQVTMLEKAESFGSTAIQDSNRIDINGFKKISEQYWRFFFHNFNFDGVNNEGAKQKESVQIMFTILNVQDHWWKSINNIIDTLVVQMDVEIILESLYYLAISMPNTSKTGWLPFHKVYQHIGKMETENSVLHSRFLSVILHLNRVLSWPFEETILLRLYSTITSRKFANFEDEWAIPQLLGRIRSRDEIPDETFFERFMLFLYTYISNLPSNGNKKRLITKLITSSHFHYQKDKAHYVMFVNRLNFILLLNQLSDFDLKNQLSDLIQRVKNSKDSDVFMLTTSALHTQTEVILSKGANLPVKSFQILVDGIIEDYLAIHGLQKIWKSIIEIFHLIVLNGTQKSTEQFLEIYSSVDESLPDKLSIDLHKLVFKALSNLGSFPRSSNSISLIAKTNYKIYSLLHKLMRKLPLPNLLDEAKLDPLIELYIQIWLKSTSLLTEPNWNKVVLQLFPYIGNAKSREKFKLYFYLQLSHFTSFQPFIDDIIGGIFKSLASYAPSKYHAELMNQLNHQKNPIILYQKKYIPEEVTSFHLSNFRSRLVLNLLTNLSRCSLPTVTKKIYLEDFLKTLNDEFDRYFSSTWFKEFCIRTVKAIQKYCGDVVPKDGPLRQFASKLSIPSYELDKYDWLSLPLKERLASLNKEFVNATQFGKNLSDLLKQYTFDEGVELIYHLSSIYARAIATKQEDKWRYVYCLLDFFNENVKLCKFHILNNSFIRFLQMLAKFTCLESKPKSNIARLYRAKTLETIVHILKFSLILFEGYNEWSEMNDLVRSSLSRDTDFDAEFEDEWFFSGFKLFDISDMRQDVPGGIQEVESNVVLEEEIGLVRLMESVCIDNDEIVTVADRCLEVELEF